MRWVPRRDPAPDNGIWEVLQEDLTSETKAGDLEAIKLLKPNTGWPDLGQVTAGALTLHQSSRS